jgi:hypothetical protein
VPWKEEGPTSSPALKVKHLSPAMKVALKALILGAAKTNIEAGKISGLHPAYIGQMKNTPLGKGFMQAHEDKVDEKLVDTSAVMELLGREAMFKMAGLMRFSADENIILRSAADLMDRAPTTQKVQKHQVESFTIGPAEARDLAAAMVESARERAKFIGVQQGDYVKIAGQEVVDTAKEDAA